MWKTPRPPRSRSYGTEKRDQTDSGGASINAAARVFRQEPEVVGSQLVARLVDPIMRRERESLGPRSDCAILGGGKRFGCWWDVCWEEGEEEGREEEEQELKKKRKKKEVETNRVVGRWERRKTRQGKRLLEPSLGKITGLYSSCSQDVQACTISGTKPKEVWNSGRHDRTSARGYFTVSIVRIRINRRSATGTSGQVLLLRE